MRKPVTPTMCSGVFVAAHKRATLPVFGGISGSTRATEGMRTQYRSNRTYRTYSKKKRRASLEGLVVSCKARSASDVCVRRWKVRAVTCWFGLSLLCGLLGSALLRGLLGSALLRGLLSTFFSCHSFYVLLLLSLGFCFLRDHKILCLLDSC